MVAMKKSSKKPTESAKAKLTPAERSFFAAIKNPKPAPEYLKEMFRLYGKKLAQG